MSAPEFRRIGEVDVDGRRRVALGRAGRKSDTKYFVEEAADGVIKLVPARTIPAREAFVWENPDLLASLQRGIEQAAVGKLEDRGSFAPYAEDDA